MKAPHEHAYAYGIQTFFAKFLLITFLILGSNHLFSQQLAFPTAEGAGAYVTGGRGGTVIKVTNLNNSGTGSLRAALLATGPRIIVFDVSGTIHLTSMIELGTANSNFTVAGQTAPEGGITIAGKPIQMGGGWNVSTQPCNNAIWRYIRFRNGSYTGVSDEYMHNGFISSGTIGLIFDHCSFSFCDDQAISMSANWGPIKDVTVQRCVFSENATGIVAGSSTAYPTGDMTFIYNLYADQGHRTPNASGILQFDIINNVYFNWGSRLTNANVGTPDVNYIGNYMKPGSYTDPSGPNKVQGITPSIYTANNYHPAIYPTPQANDQNLWKNFYWGSALPSTYFTSTQHPLLGNAPQLLSAAETYTDVLSDVGANKYLNADGTSGIFQDSFDVLKISNVLNSISSDPFNTNWTLPTIPQNTRPSNYDSNNDGMPDAWKISKGFSADANLTTHVWPSGYVGIEEFLNEIDGAVAPTYQVVAGNDETICPGESITLTASAADSFAWNTGQNGASITVNPSTTTTYTVTGTHPDGSTTTASVVVTVLLLPNANAGNDVSICNGSSTTLTASGGSSYLWSNGATTSSITVSPTDTTTYSVEVTQNGCSSSDAVTVTVNDVPTVDAGNNTTIYLGESNTLTASGANSYQWNTGATTQSITVSPTATTTYSVTGTSNGCEDTDTVTVTVIDNSVTVNAGDDVTICNGNTTTLTATGGASYEWNTGATTASIEVSPTSTTTYTVTAYDASGTGSDVDSVTVNVTQLPNSNAGNDVSICNGTSTTLTASGGSSYLWSNGATTSSITVSPISTTTYSVEVTQNGCSSSDSVTVTVNELPTVDAGNSTTIYLGESTTLTASGASSYQWNTGATTQSITVSPTSTTTYTVTGTSNGCEDNDTVTVTVIDNSVTANAGDDVTICNGNTTTLTATGGATYEWNTGATTASIEVSPSNTTTYTVTAYDASGTASDTDSVTVNVTQLPNANAGNDISICHGSSTTLTASGGSSYLWSNGATTSSITVSPTVTTTYSVEVTQNGCSSSDSVTVTVNDVPSVDAGNNTTIYLGESTTLTASGANSYQWNTGATTQSITVSPTATTTYSVTGTSNGCEDTDTVTVTVIDNSVTANAGDDVTICNGNSTTLTAIGGATYLWNTGATTASIEVSPSSTTTYTVTAFDTSGTGSDTDSVTVNVTQLPNANAGNDVSICNGSSITLTASGGSSYLWSNGATTSSITVSPTSTTTYSVEVTQNGCSSSDSVTVTVNDLPTVDAGNNTTIYLGESTTLTGSGANSYQWNTGATTQSITVSPTATTTYSVTGTSNGCEDTDTVTVTVIDNGVTANAGDDVTICNGNTTTLTATGGATYEWNTGATTASIEVSPSSTTTYTVTAYDASGTGSDTDSVTVNVTQLPNANAGNDVSICNGSSTTLTASGGSNYLWSNGATTSSITVSPTSTTTYSVEVTLNGCSSSDSVTVTVNELPTVDAGNSTTIYLGESTTLTASGANSYQWNTGATSNNITVSPTSTTTYSVTGTSNGCEDTDTVTVTVIDNSVTANAGDDVTICNGNTTTLTATGGVTYEWNTGATTASIEVSPSSTTTYTVTAYDASGTSSDTDSVTVNVTQLPNANAGNDVSICNGNSTTLTASGGSSYLWSNGATTSSISVSPTSTTTYSVEVTQNGCSANDSVTVTVNDVPTVDAGNNVSICNGSSTTLTASGGSNYLWSNGASTSSITVSPTSTTTYSVEVTQNGCSSSDSVTVTVNDVPTVDAGNNTTIYLGESTTLTASGANSYQWNTGATTQSVTVSPTSTTTYSVTGTSNGCQATDSVTVTVIDNTPTEVHAYAGEDVRICRGFSVVLTATGGESYLWSTGETTQSITVTPDHTTHYDVTVYDASGQNSDTDDVTVYVSNSPNVEITNGDDVTILRGEYVTLSAIGADLYEWSNGATQPNIAVSPYDTTVFSVTGRDNGNDCSASREVTVNVVPTVTAFAGEDQTICIGETVILTASGGDEYLWNTGETTASILVTPEETTEYSVTVYNKLDYDETSVQVIVENCDAIGEDIDPEVVESEFEFLVYPNPTAGDLNIQINGLLNVSSINIYDLAGKVIYTEPITLEDDRSFEKTINLSNYSDGLYLLKIIDGPKVITKKIVVQR